MTVRAGLFYLDTGSLLYPPVFHSRCISPRGRLLCGFYRAQTLEAALVALLRCTLRCSGRKFSLRRILPPRASVTTERHPSFAFRSLLIDKADKNEMLRVDVECRGEAGFITELYLAPQSSARKFENCTPRDESKVKDGRIANT